jgi:hypothetical protein
MSVSFCAKSLHSMPSTVVSRWAFVYTHPTCLHRWVDCHGISSTGNAACTHQHAAEKVWSKDALNISPYET